MRVGKGSKAVKEVTAKEKKIKENMRSMVISIVITLCLLIVVIAFKKAYLNEGEKVTCYVANEAIESGMEITSENFASLFSVQTRPVEYTPENCLVSKKEAYEAFTKHDMNKGDVLTNNIVSKTSSIADSMDNPVYVTISAQGISNIVGGTLRAGDYVDVYTTIAKSDGIGSSKTTATQLIKNAFVVQALTSDGVEVDRKDKKSLVTMFNLMIPSGKAKEFIEAKSQGDIIICKVYDTNAIEEKESNFIDSDTISNLINNVDSAKDLVDSASGMVLGEPYDYSINDEESTEQVEEESTEESTEEPTEEEEAEAATLGAPENSTEADKDVVSAGNTVTKAQ